MLFRSGKGRVILLASEFPFRQCVGVEFSRPLHDAAVENIRRCARHRRQCDVVESVCCDARRFSIPDGPLLLFLFNPFDDVVLGQVLQDLQESWTAAPRQVVCVYHNPVHRRSFATDFWELRKPQRLDPDDWAVFVVTRFIGSPAAENA